MDRTVYAWIAQGANAARLCEAFAPTGHVLVKFGISSEHLGEARVHRVAQRYGFGARIVHLAPAEHAEALEAFLLTLGQPAAGLYGDGSTEFRFVDEKALRAALARLGTVHLAQPQKTPQGPARGPHGGCDMTEADAALLHAKRLERLETLRENQRQRLEARAALGARPQPVAQPVAPSVWGPRLGRWALWGLGLWASGLGLGALALWARL
jgi:hypothetical protein